MASYTKADIKEWNAANYYYPNKAYSSKRIQANPFRKPEELPPLYSYSLETLKAHLDRNETILNNNNLLQKLPDNGKKLLESNKLIKEAINIKFKLMASVPSSPPNKMSTSYGHTQTRSLSEAEIQALRTRLKSKKGDSIESVDKQMNKLSISTKSYTSSSEASSSNRESLSSVSSMSNSNETVNKAIPRIMRINKNVVPLNADSHTPINRIHMLSKEESIKFQMDEERIQREYSIKQHKKVNSKAKSKTSSKISQRKPLFTGFVDDDSDDFDGFSEDEYC